MTSDEELLAVKAAEMYYLDNMTQEGIGVELFLSRWKVGRLLSLAKARNYVRIEIAHPRARLLHLERELRARFRLKDAVVVPDHGADNSVEQRVVVARAAADYMALLRPVPRTLGISWGRTLHEVAECLAEGWASGVNAVQVNGGVTLTRRQGTAAQTAMTIAQKGGGTALLMPSPAILEHKATKRVIESDGAVAHVIGAARKASTYLFGAGLPDITSVLVESGYLNPRKIESLVRAGAVGDVLGRYINDAGQVVDQELDDRTIGLTLEELKSAERTILVISGEEKSRIADAVVTNGLCNVIISNEKIARYLLRGGVDATSHPSTETPGQRTSRKQEHNNDNDQ